MGQPHINQIIVNPTEDKSARLTNAVMYSKWEAKYLCI